MISKTDQLLYDFKQRSGVLFEEYQIEPGGKQKVTIAQSLTLFGILPILIKYAPSKQITIYAQTICSSIKSCLPSWHFKDRLSDMINPEYFNLVIPILSYFLHVHIHQWIKNASLFVAYFQYQCLDLVVSDNRWRDWLLFDMLNWGVGG